MRKFNKFVLIGIIISVFILGIVSGVNIYFMLNAKEKREELKGIARRILEKPIQVVIRGTRRWRTPILPELLQDEILVDDFDVGLTSGIAHGRKNRVGSYQGTFAVRPSYAIITKSREVIRGEQGQSLVIDYRKEGGWSGWYTLLNDIDITSYNTLSFWIKGEEGGENFDVGLADAQMRELEIDACFLGPATSFLPGRFITKEWKEAKIPLSRLSSEMDLSKMGSLIFFFKYGGSGKVYVEDVKFKNDIGIAKIEAYNLPQAEKDPMHPRALWIWKIDPISNKKQRQNVFKLCKNADIGVLYLFFPEFTEMPEAGYFDSLSEFLKECHDIGIKVEALTGNPVWSLAENHYLLLNWIKFFLDYNNRRPEEERIDGVSLDVEPYLTAEWEQNRDRIKREYVDLLRQCRELVDSYQQEFRMGAAIPFFYDKEDEGAFEKEILGYVDYIALMDYYDTAKEIIGHAKFHIDLANKMNKRVVIAVETQDLISMRQGKRRNTFIEEGWEQMERQLDRVKQEFLFDPSFEGIAIHCYDSYRIMTRGRNVPTKQRKENYIIKAAQRVGDLVIDGALDDWGLSTPYEIMDEKYVLYGQIAWQGQEDLSYKFYTQWDKDALYIAMDVTDDKYIQEKVGKDMWEGDHVELWFDIDLATDLNESVTSDDDFQFGLNAGNFSSLEPEVYLWVPTLPEELKYKELVEVASSKTQSGYIVEARIPKEILLYERQISVGNVESMQAESSGTSRPGSEEGASLGLPKGGRIGIMIDVGDTDDITNPMKVLMSTSQNRVWGDPTTFGVLELE
ncbi:MAG: hypothetical protein HQ547_03025 [Candidatus Omnitrophica bacterium]|nr:hypothetical protein [Candidatus Omnitrophota bacterium]